MSRRLLFGVGVAIMVAFAAAGAICVLRIWEVLTDYYIKTAASDAVCQAELASVRAGIAECNHGLESALAKIRDGEIALIVAQNDFEKCDADLVMSLAEAASYKALLEQMTNADRAAGSAIELPTAQNVSGDVGAAPQTPDLGALGRVAKAIGQDIHNFALFIRGDPRVRFTPGDAAEDFARGIQWAFRHLVRITHNAAASPSAGPIDQGASSPMEQALEG